MTRPHSSEDTEQSKECDQEKMEMAALGDARFGDRGADERAREEKDQLETWAVP